MADIWSYIQGRGKNKHLGGASTSGEGAIKKPWRIHILAVNKSSDHSELDAPIHPFFQNIGDFSSNVIVRS